MNVPRHIAIILDGNGRWARKRGLPRSAGHRKGMQRIKEIVREAGHIGVEWLTVFAFSTENWKRPDNEISTLFSYLDSFLDDRRNGLMKSGVRIRFIGNLERLGDRIESKIRALEKKTENNNNINFVIALDYGGKWDIVQAARKIAQAARDGEVLPENIDEDFFSQHLCLNGIPDPELLIRTSGEQRLSNFLIWNLAYSEFYFTPVLWPDFDRGHLIKAVDVYSRRLRRFGGVSQEA